MSPPTQSPAGVYRVPFEDGHAMVDGVAIVQLDVGAAAGVEGVVGFGVGVKYGGGCRAWLDVDWVCRDVLLLSELRESVKGGVVYPSGLFDACCLLRRVDERWVPVELDVLSSLAELIGAEVKASRLEGTVEVSKKLGI